MKERGKLLDKKIRNILEENFTIEHRIRKFKEETDSEMMEKRADDLTEAILERMMDDGIMLVPIGFTDEKGNQMDFRDMTYDEVDELLRSYEGEISLTMVNDEEEEKNWLPVFTSVDEYMLADEPESMMLPDAIRHLFELVDSFELDGIVIDPFGDLSINMPKELIEAVMEAVEEEEANNDGDINLVEGDITALKVDAIVNAANNTLLGGNGVDGAIHRAAGPDLLKECRDLHGCATGQAKLTGGYELPADYVIHTVGPIYSGDREDPELLADCYWNSLDLALAHGDIKSIAFPAISTGVFGYPKKEAATIAVDTVLDWLDEHEGCDMKITFCVYNKEMYDIYQKILDDLLGQDD